MSRILPLSPDAISQIQSSKHITSLQGVILSLLENSLDAGSSKVEIIVDFRRGGCTVEDNGSGIPSSEFHEDGGLGKTYHTSKYTTGPSDNEVYGHAGAYLASLAALSLMNITSCQGGSHDHATIAMHHGETIARQVPGPPGQGLTLSRNSGTRVVVRDLFGNMAVRVKQRAITTASGLEDEKAWQELKRGVVALLLAWKKPCAVRVRDVENSGKILSLSALHPSVSNALTEKSLRNLAGKENEYDIRDSLSVVYQAGLAPSESRTNWIPVSASMGNLSVKGVLCLDPAPTKQCQFISIGIHPCSASSGHNDLYDAVNKIFVNSSFGSVADDSEIDDMEKDRRSRDRRYKKDGFTQKQLHTRNGVDRWPMFVLQVKFRDHHSSGRIDADNVSDASLKVIVEILTASVTQWLAAHHFRPRKQRRKNGEQQGPAVVSRSSSADSRPSTPRLEKIRMAESASPSKKRKILDHSTKPGSADHRPATAQPTGLGYFNSWSRIKSGRESFYEELWQGRKPATAPEKQADAVASPAKGTSKAFCLPSVETGSLNTSKSRSGKPLVQSQGVNAESRPQMLSSEDFGSVDDAEMVAAARDVERTTVSNPDEEDDSTDAVVDWTDPATKQMYRVNARTGVVLPSKPQTRRQDSNENATARQSAAINTNLSSAGRPLNLANRTRTGDTPRWLPGFLKEWNNPVFVRQNEEKIPVASLDGPGLEAMTTGCTHDDQTNSFAEVGQMGTSKISKAALKQAKVVRQVDRKFILCRMPSEKTQRGEALVLVDQHAVSERVILERLLRELCTPVAGQASKVASVQLNRHLRYQVSEPEYRLFQDHSGHFANWGILYDLTTNHENLHAFSTASEKSKEQCMVIVTSLPPTIAERCSLVPKLLIDLLRAEIWTLAESPTKSTRAPTAGNESSDAWLNRLATCPNGLLEMLNSRACRSAVMFNDDLSTQECEVLLEALAKCVFPFMCAHGRVSMVPLVEVGVSGGGLFGEEGLGEGFGDGVSAGNESGFAEAFGSWKGATLGGSGTVDC